MIWTPIGILVVPLGLLLFLLGRRYVFWATVASIPSFAVVVVETSWTMISPFEYFGGLLLCRQLVDILAFQRFDEIRLPRAIVPLLAFLGVIYVSLAMPVILHGQVEVVTQDTWYMQYDSVTPLQFSRSNITQILFPTFMVAMTVGLYRELLDATTRQRVIKLLIVLAIPVLVSGVVFQLLTVFKGPHAAGSFLALFMSPDSIPELLREERRLGGVGSYPRMFTLAGEPGYTSLYLCFALGLILGVSSVAAKPVWLPRWDRVYIVLISIGIIATAATTGYFGFVFLLIGAVWLSGLGVTRATRGLTRRMFIRGLAVLVLVVVMTYVVLKVGWGVSLFDYLIQRHWHKLTEGVGSGATRWRTVTYSLQSVFMKSPILGVGYGSHRTAALVTSLLANTGVVGLLAFLAYNFGIVRRAVRIVKRASTMDSRAVGCGLLMAFCGIFPVMLFGKSLVALVFGWYWVLCALVVAECRDTVRTARASQRRSVEPRTNELGRAFS